ncbi:fructose PTS transporter subunit IIA [Arthrobacter sp.]|uniref:PTS sugar transporter subunit IIA n=1 Tax=Arthrobacter sp. TaxID=1667 RepID=UPI00258F13B7|nr:fructose PTS transporter subunit IIA [Arthrobacter sp.]
MTAVLAPENVLLDVDATTQAAVFDAIAAQAAALGITAEPAAVVAGLVAREAQGTTGLMDGIAIPHAKSPAIGRAALVVLRLRDGVEWETLDGAPVRLAISLLIPESEAGTTHLKLLSKVARTLMKAPVRAELLAAESPESLVEILGEHVLA